jgi:hypothetical protein
MILVSESAKAMHWYFSIQFLNGTYIRSLIWMYQPMNTVWQNIYHFNSENYTKVINKYAVGFKIRDVLIIKQTVFIERIVHYALNLSFWGLVWFTGAFEKCVKWILASLYLSVSQHGKAPLLLEGFSLIWYLSIFRNCQEYSSLIKIWQE